MTTPNDLAHQALAKAQREHAAAWLPVTQSIEEVQHVLDYWTREAGIESLGQAIRLTEITVNNIQEEDY